MTFSISVLAVNSLKERDWGMAAFYASRLRQIISEEVENERRLRLLYPNGVGLAVTTETSWLP